MRELHKICVKFKPFPNSENTQNYPAILRGNCFNFKKFYRQASARFEKYKDLSGRPPPEFFIVKPIPGSENTRNYTADLHKSSLYFIQFQVRKIQGIIRQTSTRVFYSQANSRFGKFKKLYGRSPTDFFIVNPLPDSESTKNYTADLHHL